MLVFFIFTHARAQVVLTNFSIQSSYLSNGKLLVNDKNVATSFKANLTLMRGAVSTGGFEPGDCQLTILYTENPSDFVDVSNSSGTGYEEDPSTIELMSIKYVNSSNYSFSLADFYGSTALSAVLPANKTSGKILLRYKAYDRVQGKDVIRYSQTKYQIYNPPPPPVVANDNYTGAISLTTTAIAGTTVNATQSSQGHPPCGNGNDIDDDVWYKFVATSTSHVVSLTDINFHNAQSYESPLAAIAVYNSSLGYIECDNINGKVSAASLTIGQTYYVRVWSDNVNSNAWMTYKIAVSIPNSSNFILGISQTGNPYEHILTATYSLDTSIPTSDITFEWIVWPGEVEPATDYSVVQGAAGLHQIYVIAGPNEGDTTVRAKVRIKRISTNEPLTDWYTYSALIWFG